MKNKTIIIIAIAYLIGTSVIYNHMNKINDQLRKDKQYYYNVDRVELLNIIEAHIRDYEECICEYDFMVDGKEPTVEGNIWHIASEVYGIEYELLMAIAMHETGHFKSKAWNELNNPGGIMGSNGLRKFNTREQGIMEMARLLRLFYIDQGLTTIEQIQRKYAPIGSDNDPNNINRHWVNSVTSLYNQLRKENKHGKQ